MNLTFWTNPTPHATLPLAPRNVGDVCPLTLERLDALDTSIIGDDRYVYDRTALMRGMQIRNDCTSPMTRAAMPDASIALFGRVLGELPSQKRDAHDGLVIMSMTASALVGTVMGCIAVEAAKAARAHWQRQGQPEPDNLCARVAYPGLLLSAAAVGAGMTATTVSLVGVGLGALHLRRLVRSTAVLRRFVT